MKNSTVNQAMLYLIIMILAFPFLVSLSNTYAQGVAFTLGLISIVILTFGLVIFMKKWEDRDKNKYVLIPFYIELFLFYSLAYTFAAVASPSGGFISGFTAILPEGNTYKFESAADYWVVFSNIFLVFLDSLYYSVSIMTTLGDGNIKPQHIMKLVVASHVGFTFFITVFAVAEYFASQSNKEIEKEFENLKKLLSQNNANLNAAEETNNLQTEIKPLKERFYISIKGLFTGKYV
ncbi:ion channel [Vibrio lentus]